MRVRVLAGWIVRLAAGLVSLATTGYGLYSCTWADFKRDTILMAAFCLLPVLSLPVFLMSLWKRRWPVYLLWVFAGLYLLVYSLLDWRTCAELGYCRGVAETVFLTLKTRPVAGYLAVASLNHAGTMLSARRPGRVIRWKARG